jgi:uncharacterized protein YciI
MISLQGQARFYGGMIYVVLFTDNPAYADQRGQLMPQHLAFLDANAARIRAAGPLTEPDGAGAGGLWLVEADSAEAVMALIHADPFWPTGLRQSVRVLEWTQVFAEGRRLI